MKEGYDFGKTFDRILAVKEEVRKDLQKEILSARSAAQRMEADFEQIIVGRARLENSSLEGERHTLQQEIVSLRSFARMEEERMEEIVRVRVLLKMQGLLPN